MKIYLDVCCYNRPFDDLSYDRIRLEAEAVSIILERCEQGLYELISSDIIYFEVDQIPNQDKKDAVFRLVKLAGNQIKKNTNIINRAHILESFRIKPYDALHLAFAE